MTTTKADDDSRFSDWRQTEDIKEFSGALPPAVSAALKAQDIQALYLAIRQMPRD